jgi:hypothetical protein
MARSAPAEADGLAQIGRVPAAALSMPKSMSCTVRRRQVTASILPHRPGAAFGEAHHLDAEACARCLGELVERIAFLRRRRHCGEEIDRRLGDDAHAEARQHRSPRPDMPHHAAQRAEPGRPLPGGAVGQVADAGALHPPRPACPSSAHPAGSNNPTTARRARSRACRWPRQDGAASAPGRSRSDRRGLPPAPDGRYPCGCRPGCDRRRARPARRVARHRGRAGYPH